MYREDGQYILKFYRNRKPIIIRIDDCLPSKQYNIHAFCQVSNKENTRELWPLLVEKAYAKLYGSYDNIEGGLIDAALIDLTNGAGDRISL